MSEQKKHRLPPEIEMLLIEEYPDEQLNKEENFCVRDMYLNTKEVSVIDIYQEINTRRTSQYFSLSQALFLAREILANDKFFQDKDKKYLILFSATGVFGYAVYSILVSRDVRNQAHLKNLNIIAGFLIPENTKILYKKSM